MSEKLSLLLPRELYLTVVVSFGPGLSFRGSQFVLNDLL
jgi:hypothetical protein